MPQLFSYGTIQDPKIQIKIAGRAIPMKPDSVCNFRMSDIEIDGTTYPILISDTQQKTPIKGHTLTVSEAELKAFDDYEGEDYKKSFLLLESGTKAWVYHQ